MKRVAWITDPHLNFLPTAQVEKYLAEIAAQRPDGLLISGDIAESQDVCDYLQRIHAAVEAPIYFVLGNHDFYHGSILQTRSRVAQLCERLPRLHYLTTEHQAYPLSDQVGVVGHDGWADGRLGNYGRSLVKMLDWKLIEELQEHDRQSRWGELKRLGDEAATHIREVLPGALASFHEVVLVTHVPPFLEACWHEGKISDDQWSPHFTCQAVGQAILETMDAHPDRRLLVVCGHTHGQGETRPRANIEVLTGGAEYGAPRIARMFEFA